LGLLRELVPRPGPIAFLLDPKAPSAALQTEELLRAAQALQQPIVLLESNDGEEVDRAFATMTEKGVVGLLYGASTLFQVLADRLVALAARYRIPAVYEWREFVAAGGLLSYSTDRPEFGRLAGDYVGRILKGAAPADLPVVQSSRFVLAINLKTAKALGLTVPQSLLARADEVIE
jgi:putative ABC transport system substrate-binding protein